MLTFQDVSLQTSAFSSSIRKAEKITLLEFCCVQVVFVAVSVAHFMSACLQVQETSLRLSCTNSM